MSLAIIWVVMVNCAAGGLAFFLLRALYREVVKPLLEERKKRPDRFRKTPWRREKH